MLGRLEIYLRKRIQNLETLRHKFLHSTKFLFHLSTASHPGVTSSGGDDPKTPKQSFKKIFGKIKRSNSGEKTYLKYLQVLSQTSFQKRP